MLSWIAIITKTVRRQKGTVGINGLIWTYSQENVWRFFFENVISIVLSVGWNLFRFSFHALRWSGNGCIPKATVILNVQFSSVQGGIYALGKAHMRSTRVSDVSPTLPWNSSTVRPIDDGPLSSFQRRSSSVSSSIASLLQAIDGVCLWLCARWQCLKFLSISDLTRSKPLVRVALPSRLSARSFSFSPACPGQYTHRRFRRWTSTIDTLHSGLPIPLFTFCSKLIQSVRMMACVVWLSPRETIQRKEWVTASTSIVKLEIETV